MKPYEIVCKRDLGYYDDIGRPSKKRQRQAHKKEDEEQMREVTVIDPETFEVSRIEVDDGDVVEIVDGISVVGKHGVED